MQNSTSDKFLKGISVQTVISVTKGLLQIIVFAIFSRLLSRIDFGYYAALTGITMVFLGISDAGIGCAVVQKKDLTDKYRSTAFTMSIIVGFFVGVLFFLATPILSELIVGKELLTPLRWMTIPLVLHSVNGYAGSVLVRDLKFGITGGMRILSYLISSIIAIVFALNGGGVYSLIALFVLDAIIYTVFIYSRINIPKLDIGRDDAKSVVSFGGWLTLGVIMSTISSQLDKLVLGKWLSIERLGAYNRPSGFISNIIGQINNVFDVVLFPILSTFQDSKEQFCKILYSSFGLLSTMGSLMAFMLFFNSKLIIHIFFGNEWFDLVPIMQISSLNAIFMLNNTLADCFFRSFNLVKVGFFIRTGGIILTLLFVYFGAQYDILGVAIAILLSNLIIVIFKFYYLCYKSSASIGQLIIIILKSWKPSVPILLTGSFLLFLPQCVFSEIAIAVILVGISLLLLIRFPKFMGDEYMTLIYSRIQMTFVKFRFVDK